MRLFRRHFARCSALMGVAFVLAFSGGLVFPLSKRVEELPQYARDLSGDELDRLIGVVAENRGHEISDEDANHLVAHLRRHYPFRSLRDRLPKLKPIEERRLMKALEDLSTQYDATVRNSTGGIVQLVYGDDGLDPVGMEGKKNQPIDFTRTMFRIQAAYPHGETPPLLKEEMKMRLVEQLSEHNMITAPVHPAATCLLNVIRFPTYTQIVDFTESRRGSGWSRELLLPAYYIFGTTGGQDTAAP